MEVERKQRIVQPATDGPFQLPSGVLPLPLPVILHTPQPMHCLYVCRSPRQGRGCSPLWGLAPAPLPTSLALPGPHPGPLLPLGAGGPRSAAGASITGGGSLLVVGPPGVGKTTLLRDITRLLADDLGLAVVVVDTSNEIAGK